jgi:hypothetical protein
MGDSVWIRTEGGNWYPGKVSSNNVKRGQTRQVLDLAIDSIGTKYCCFIERGVILPRNIPHWLTHQKKFRTIERGDKAGYAENTYITSSGWVVVVVLLLSLRIEELCARALVSLTGTCPVTAATTNPRTPPTHLRLHHHHDKDISYGGICREGMQDLSYTLSLHRMFIVLDAIPRSRF